MTAHGDPRGPERVAEAAQAEGLALAGCPTPCDDGCEAACHEAHRPPSKRWHEPGWSCAEVQLAIARTVAAERERITALAKKHRAHYGCYVAIETSSAPVVTSGLRPFADLIRETT